jgi:porphobilinogen deaminase
MAQAKVMVKQYASIDVYKDALDMVLLEKDPDVLVHSVRDGRTTFLRVSVRFKQDLYSRRKIG